MMLWHDPCFLIQRNLLVTEVGMDNVLKMIASSLAVTTRRYTHSVVVLGLAVLTFGAAPAETHAQSGDGYLLNQPRMTLKFESGYVFSRANSDIFDFVIGQHTLSPQDFQAPYFGAELGFRANEKVDLTFAFGFQETSSQSEFRDWVDEDDLPITQVTALSQVPFTVGAKIYPLSRGRSIGNFAWVPSAVAPFVGVSTGLVSYSFEQYGDFVDQDTFDIFYGDFLSENVGWLTRASAGLNISVGPRFLFSLEGRYNWAKARMDGDYYDFGQIDLDGFQLIGGLAVRF